MHDYQSLLLYMVPIEEKDLILFDMGAEEKARIVKQYNHALVNAQGDGTDVAEIFLKPLIANYQKWGDTALMFGLCLAREGRFERAEQSLQFAIANVLGNERYLAIAQDALKMVRDDMKNPESANIPKELDEKLMDKKMAESGSPADRQNYQAPILVKASKAAPKNNMATPKERRDVMMRSGSVGDALPDDSIDIEPMKSPAEKMRLTVRIIIICLILAAVAAGVVFGLIPLGSKMQTASENEKKINYLLDKFEEKKDDPEVAGILEDYAREFGIGGGSK